MSMHMDRERNETVIRVMDFSLKGVKSVPSKFEAVVI